MLCGSIDRQNKMLISLRPNFHRPMVNPDCNVIVITMLHNSNTMNIWNICLINQSNVQSYVFTTKFTEQTRLLHVSNSRPDTHFNFNPNKNWFIFVHETVLAQYRSAWSPSNNRKPCYCGAMGIDQSNSAPWYHAASLPWYYHGSEVVVTWYYHEIVW